MNRSGQTVSALIAFIGIAKILYPSFIGQFFALDMSVAFIAVGVAVIAYGVWHGPLKFLSGSIVTGLLGLSVLVIGAASISSPTLLGLRGTYLPITDIFLLLESGIVLQMIGLEKRRPETLSPLLFASLAGQLVMRRFSHSSRGSEAVAATR